VSSILREAMHSSSLRHGQSARAAATAIVLLVALSLGWTSPPQSRADGDPASDVLPVQDVFFPYQPKVSHGLEVAMERTVRAAKGAGVNLKVAIIAAPFELGLVRTLFRQPQAYAEFLGREISFNQPQPLLVVMPAGFGVVPSRRSGALAHVPVDARHGSDGLTRSAILAVVALARDQGHAIGTPSMSASSRKSSPPALLVFGLPALLLVLVGLVMTRRWRSRPDEHPDGREGG
jgi:hypothetical protein